MASYSYTFQSGDGVTPTRLNDARTVSDIVNADIKSDAAIAGTKIAPDFGSQNITTSGIIAVTSDDGALLNLSRASSNTAASQIAFFKSRNTQASQQAVASGDSSGLVRFYGYDGASNLECARIQASIDGTPGTNDMPGRLVFSTTADGASTPTERMRITSDGYLFFGTTTDAGAGGISFYPNNDDGAATMVWNRNTTTASSSVLIFRNAGSASGSISHTNNATSFNTSSDYRLKENAAPLTIGLATVDQLSPVEFTWKSDGSIGRGFIAHELQAVVPEAVTGEKDAVDAEGNPEYQGVDAAKLVPYLVSAVKELKARVEALEAA